MKRWMAGLAALLALALGGCGIGNPWPSVSSNQSVDHVALMVGDSLLGGNDWSMVETLNKFGFTNVTVVDAHINGTGLIGPVPYTAPDGTVTPYASALSWVQYQVTQNPEVDTVVMEYGGACGICDQWVPGSVAYGSDAFYNTWINNAKAIIDWLHAQGKTVFWVKSPQSGASGAVIASGNQYKVEVAKWLSLFDEQILAPYAGTPSPDWWYALNDTTGAFQQQLFYDNVTHTVRLDDLVHVTEDGSRRMSTWTIATLSNYWANQVGALSAPPEFQVPNRLVQVGDPVTLR